VHAILDDPKATPAPTRTTFWGLYNAIVKAEDFRNAQQSAESRLERVWFGSGQELKIKALNFAREHLQRAA
jgi:hypothetical protein